MWCPPQFKALASCWACLALGILFVVTPIYKENKYIYVSTEIDFLVFYQSLPQAPLKASPGVTSVVEGMPSAL